MSEDALNSSRRNFKFRDVHVDGAERIAKIAAQAGVPRFIHVSHLNASPVSTSTFYKSRFEGEEKVKEAYPGATIIRPTAMFGYEDRLLNNMASKFPEASWLLRRNFLQCSL